MPMTIAPAIAIVGSTFMIFSPDLRRDIDATAIKTDARPIIKEGPICMIAGLIFSPSFVGGASSLKTRLWIFCIRRGAGKKLLPSLSSSSISVSSSCGWGLDA